jgi:hypothetical protein
LNTEEYNKGVSFRIPEATYSELCRAVSGVAGVVFINERRSFWSASTVETEFTFQGFTFEIERDAWDDTLWILTKDKQKHEVEMQTLRDAVEKFGN